MQKKINAKKNEQWITQTKKKKKKKNHKRVFVTYLCGHVQRSCSSIIKSIKALQGAAVGRGGGSKSILQNLVLTNPCRSIIPLLRNCSEVSFLFFVFFFTAQNPKPQIWFWRTQWKFLHLLEESILEFPRELASEAHTQPTHSIPKYIYLIQPFHFKMQLNQEL